MSLKIDPADRILKLPPYLFVEIDRLKNIALSKGKDIIDLGIGDPDIPTPSVIVNSLKKAVENPAYHRYPSTVGMLSFRETACSWFKSRFGVSIDPTKEITSIIGSKEGIGHIPFAFVNPGDYVLVPDPAYPVYKNATMFAGGKTYTMPLLKENGFIPDLKSIPEDIAKKSKLIFLNYPNNPTAALATKDFFEELVEFALKYNIIVCHDAAYTEICFDGYKAPSFLEIDGAKDVGIEYHSLSKTFCMTGWRLGFAVGNAEVIAGLIKIKSNLDSGAFQAIQEAGITALTDGLSPASDIYDVFKTRRDTFVSGIQKLGLECESPKSTFYVWITVPKGYRSSEFAMKLLNDADLILTPGNGFGEYGEGYIRAALTVPVNRLEEAIERIRKVI